jgi:hypothetical protein
VTDISGLFAQDDAVFDLELPGTKVVWQIRSLKNPESQAIVKRQRNKMFGKRMIEKGEIDPEEIGQLTFMEAATDPSDEQLAACVTGWDWADHTLGDFNLEYSYKNVLAIIKAVPKIRGLVLQKAIAITDFTKA